MAAGLAASSVAPRTALSDVLDALKLGKREEQTALFLRICESLNTAEETGIVAAQGATGVGKTTIAQAIAVEWLRGNCRSSPSPVVVVAFPSLQGVKTFATQWEKARSAGLPVPAIEVLVGRGEFVSRGAVELLLDDPATHAPNLSAEELQGIRDWLSQQDAARPTGTWTRFGAWLIDGLLSRVASLDREALTINGLSAPTDPGVVAYEEQFSRAHRSSIIVCSHHMLAFDVLLRQQSLGRIDAFRQARSAVRDKYFSPEVRASRDEARKAGGHVEGIAEVVARVTLEHEMELLREGELLEQRRLPPYQHLVVDEAHLLEQAFSSCFSSSVSLRETARRLAALARIDGRREVRDAAAAVKGACIQISSAGKDNEVVDFVPSLATDGQAVTALRTIAWALKSFKPGRRVKQEALPLLSALERDSRVIDAALDSGGRGVRLLDFSPVRHYPHLVVGEGDVRQPLHTLWAGVRSAVLLSATLYLRRSDGWSARYIANLQSVPSHRLKEIPVVEAPWIVTPVQNLFMPDVGGRSRSADPAGALPWLMPPSRRDRLQGEALERAQDQWLVDVVDAVRWIHRTAAGSILVPSTSHEMVRGLASRLRHPSGPDRASEFEVLASTDFPSLGALRDAGIVAARDGRRFVMLATGAAWTGFDLSGKELGLDAVDDNLLTDLVVPKLPFGMNRSITHRRRAADKRDPVNHEVMSVALLVQQALGRLVRRPGLPRNRRMFLLDRRLVDPTLAGWLSPVHRVLEHYPKAVLDWSAFEYRRPSALPFSRATS